MPEGKALPQLGTDLGHDSSSSHGEDREARSRIGASPEQKDYFQERDGVRFAGTHLIIDLWGARRLDDLAHIEKALRDCVEAAGATLLHLHLHHFTPGGGVSGVAVLAESHISVHTWPERDYAAFDVFMCGDTKPRAAVEILHTALAPSRIEVSEHLRGRADP